MPIDPKLEARLVAIHDAVSECRRLLQTLQNEANLIWSLHTAEVDDPKPRQPVRSQATAPPARRVPPRRHTT